MNSIYSALCPDKTPKVCSQTLVTPHDVLPQDPPENGVPFPTLSLPVTNGCPQRRRLNEESAQAVQGVLGEVNDRRAVATKNKKARTKTRGEGTPFFGPTDVQKPPGSLRCVF